MLRRAGSSWNVQFRGSLQLRGDHKQQLVPSHGGSFSAHKCATGRSCPHKEALFYKCKAYKGILALSRHAPVPAGSL